MINEMRKFACCARPFIRPVGNDQAVIESHYSRILPLLFYEASILCFDEKIKAFTIYKIILNCWRVIATGLCIYQHVPMVKMLLIELKTLSSPISIENFLIQFWRIQFLLKFSTLSTQFLFLNQQFD